MSICSYPKKLRGLDSDDSGHHALMLVILPSWWYRTPEHSCLKTPEVLSPDAYMTDVLP